MSDPSAGALHWHGSVAHAHPYSRPHRHLRLLRRSRSEEHEHRDRHHSQQQQHAHAEHGEHGHSHGLVDRSILRSHAGVRAVAASLAILGVTAAVQLAIFALSSSVALLADLIHNFGDALTAVPLGIAFFLGSVRGERFAGLAVVLAIFVSACVALYVTVMRFIHPQHLSHLWVLAVAGLIGFVGNELAARVRLSAGERLASAAMTADGKHARIDGFVSLGVVASAIVVALGAQIADPIIGLSITLVILKITSDSWHAVRNAVIDLGHIDDHHHHDHDDHHRHDH